jgi:hypothetical protein
MSIQLRSLERMGEWQVGKIGGTYIKPKASLGVRWAFRRGEGIIRRGREDGETGEKWG